MGGGDVEVVVMNVEQVVGDGGGQQQRSETAQWRSPEELTSRSA